MIQMDVKELFALYKDIDSLSTENHRLKENSILLNRRYEEMLDQANSLMVELRANREEIAQLKARNSMYEDRFELLCAVNKDDEIALFIDGRYWTWNGADWVRMVKR